MGAYRYDRRYDVIVVGAGHAGCEAALAAARMGCSVLLLTMNVDSVAQMSCNPAIGGLAKGHLVREIDALGGEMARAIDRTGIQFRMLNRSKGPAVWSPRAQADRMAYRVEMGRRLEAEERIDLKQAHVTDVLVDGGRAEGIRTETGTEVEGRIVVLTTGTFLNGLMHIGLVSMPGGRATEFPSVGLSDCLRRMGLRLGRLKTGTPPRLDGSTVNRDAMVRQEGDEVPTPFSFGNEALDVEQVPCYITRSNEETHDIIRGGLDRSPLYTGRIRGVGPRYCPSIEDKVVRFPEKGSHQLFVEPEGRETREVYLSGFATSLPEDVQVRALRTMRGMEDAEVVRPGYAVEYDFVFPTQLRPWLETKRIKGLFLAGQINGTSGYEEAAAQGLIAGANAALKLRGDSPFVLGRSEAYIGVLIDDLVTKGTKEPYRMFTSLAEYRLLLRQDNADVRLVEQAQRLGLVEEGVVRARREKRRRIEEAVTALRRTRVDVARANRMLDGRGSSRISEPCSLARLLKRPEVTWGDVGELAELSTGDGEAGRQAAIEIKYEGYVVRQRVQVERFQKMEARRIPEDVDYSALDSLSAEAREKLAEVRPVSIGQASRISGIAPSDIWVLMIHLERRRREAGGHVSRETIKPVNDISCCFEKKYN